MIRTYAGRRDQGGRYIENASVAVVSVAALTLLGFYADVPTDHPLVIWLGAGLVTGAFVAISLAFEYKQISLPCRWLRLPGFVGYFVALAWVLVAAHRLSILPIAAAETFVFVSLRPRLRSRRGFAFTFVVASFAWTMASAIMWEPIDDFLLSASHANALATIAFAGSLFFVSICELSDAPITRIRRLWLVLGVAGGVFLAFSLQTRNLYADWIPYHRSYFVGPAMLIRQGHWLLWDVPSQYGFLSVLAIAVFPGVTRWQALYFITAISVTTQATIVFWLLRYGRSSAITNAVALIITLALFFGSEAARYPFNALIYPQQGIRFVWLMGLEAVMFAAYVKRDNAGAVKVIDAVGWSIWIISVLWAFEVGIWSTFAWFIFLAVRACERTLRSKRRMRSATREAFWIGGPAVILLFSSMFIIEQYYRVHLGHGPDWRSYIELSLSYANGKVPENPMKLFGTGLTLVALLGGLATLTSLVIRSAGSSAAAVSIGVASSAWMIAVYFVGESEFNVHVNMIVPNIACAFAILAAILRERASFGISAKYATLTIVPVYTLFLASFVADPMRSIPFLTHPEIAYAQSTAETFPAVSGNIATLVRRAGVKPTDLIIFQHYDNGVKLGRGVTMPFVRFGDRVVEMRPWAPVSPVGEDNTLITLSPSRRSVILRRYFSADRNHGGWLVAHARVPDCSSIGKQFYDRDVSALGAFSIARCVSAKIDPMAR